MNPDHWPLRGVRVLDLSTGIAGPYATKLLADAGADVVKVEPAEGDPLRRWSASHQPLEGRDGALFQFLNAGKRSVVQDLACDRDREKLLRLVPGVQLVVESFGPGGMESRGLGFDRLRERHRAVSLVSISDWGGEGPFANRPATEFTLQAEIGGTAYRGLPERGPVAAGGRAGEWAAGTYAGVAALAAWRSARSSGSGQHVDCSIFESMLLSMTVYHDLFGQFFEGPLEQALELPSIEPAKDGWVGLCTYTGQQWKDLCALMGRPDIGEDPRFYDGRARMQHMDFIQGVVHGWTREQTVQEIVELCTAMRIPVAPIGDGRTVLEMDHLRERGVFVDHPGGFKQPRTPYRIEGLALPPVRRAPALGEHTEEIEAAIPETPSASAAASAVEEAPLPFEGLRIVDLTAFWAGPVVTSTLGALGADVVKVESVQRPDGMRLSGAVRTDRLWEHSAVFHGANTNKRAITLDLEREEGKALLRRLLADADVLIENFSARVMENFGFDQDRLRSLNPRLITVRMPAWGLDGPWRDRTGFAPTVEQASGLAWITGYEDLPLILRGFCDPVGGMHAIVALTMALEERERTGRGMLVEVPLIEPALNIAAEQVIEYTAYGELLTRTGNRGPRAAPQGVYRARAASGEPRYARTHLALAVVDDEQWRALVDLLGRPEWAVSSALGSEAGRRANEEDIDARLAAFFADQEVDEIVERLVEAGIPAAALANAHYVWPHPQLEARGFFEDLEHPVVGRKRYPSLPFRFASREGGWHRSPPPLLGQHNEAVLGVELGLSSEELNRLHDEKVIGDRPAFEIG